MTGSPVFSISLTCLRIPANPNYHMSIKKSQAILKREEREKRKEESGKRKEEAEKSSKCHKTWLFIEKYRTAGHLVF